MSDINGLTDAQVTELMEFDTPTVCNVIELWNIRPRNTGFMNESIKACFPKMPPMIGYAVTSTFRSMAPPRSGDVYAGLVQQVESFADMAGPPLIVYQDIDEPTVSATFGEVMCTTYKSFGARGLITSGTGRDLDQVEAIDFPCFTNGSTCAHGYCHTLSVNVPVTVGGICVNPGDLLHGDLNGVTTIPHEIASEIAGACRDLAAAEDIILNYLRSGDVSPKGLGDVRGECGNVIAELGKRLRGEG